MTTYAFPTFTRAIPYTDWKFGMEPNSRVFTSPLSGQSQSVDLPGARWALNLRLAGLSDAERGEVEAFMAKLRGRANRFTCHDLINPIPRGTMRGSPVTVGTTAAGAVSVVINAGGGQASTTVLAGDKLSIGGELKVNTTTVTLNGSGQGTLTVEPPFRAQISAGASVVWDRPTAQFMLVENSWRLNYSAPRFADLALDAIEVFS
jgi:hypothetical protein